MGRRKDSVWEHAEDLGNKRFRCNFCRKEFPGGAPRLKSHLSGVTGRHIAICPKVSAQIQREVCEEFGIGPKKAETGATSNVQNFKSEVDRLYAKYTIINEVLLDVTESAIFTNFVNGVAEYGFGYELPSSLVLKSELLPNIKEQVEEYVQNAIESAKETGYTLYYSCQLQSIFAYTPKGVVCLDSITSLKESKVETTSGCIEKNGAVCLDSITSLKESTVEINSSCIEKNGAVCSDSITSLKESKVEIISGCIQKIGATHVAQLIIDRDEDSIQEALSKEFPSIFQTACPISAIKGSLLNIFSEKALVNNILSLAIMIDHFICKYEINVQVQHGWGDYWGLHKLALLSSMERRIFWGIHKLTSLLEVENELQGLQVSIATLSSGEWKQGIDKETCDRDAKYIDFLIHCEGFWHQGRYLASSLRLVVEAFYLLVDNEPSSGQSYEAMKRLRAAKLESFGKDHINNFVGFKTEGRSSRNKIHAVSAFLNPIYMGRREWKEDSEMKDGIEYLFEVVEGDEKEILQEQVERYRETVPNMSIDEGMTARMWWDRYGSDLDVLKRHAIWILNQPCSSSFCPEYRLHVGTLDDARLLALNIMLMERYTSPEAQISEAALSNEEYEEYEREYRRGICWFQGKFSKIEQDSTFSWLKKEELDFDIEEEAED